MAALRAQVGATARSIVMREQTEWADSLANPTRRREKAPQAAARPPGAPSAPPPFRPAAWPVAHSSLHSPTHHVTHVRYALSLQSLYDDGTLTRVRAPPIHAAGSAGESLSRWSTRRRDRAAAARAAALDEAAAAVDAGADRIGAARQRARVREGRAQ